MNIRTRAKVFAFVVGAGVTISACSSSSGTTSTTGSPTNVPLLQAVSNTLSARNYSEVVSQDTSQGKQTGYLKYQSPDRLGGYIQNGSKRTYVYFIGSTEYQSQAVSNNTPTKQLTFHTQAATQGVTGSDPAHGYLPYATQAKNPTRSGDTYSFKLTQQGQTGTFSYTVNGQYVSKFTLRVPPSSVQLDISAVGSSPQVSLPTGSKVSSASSAPTTAPSP
jgi:hypothetical protein